MFLGRRLATASIACAALVGVIACGGGGPRASAPRPPVVPSAAASAAPEPPLTLPVVVDVAPLFRVTLPPGASKAVERATFSADGKTLDVARDGGVVERYDLVAGARIDATPPSVPAPTTAVFPTQEGSSVTLTVGASERRTLAAIAKEIGGTIIEPDGDVVLSHPDRTLGTDGSRFVWFDGKAGTTLVRLDTGARKTFRPWTTGFSGMGMRTGGTIVFDFGPDVDRAVVSSWSQMGATVGMDDPRLVDTRTMTELGRLPGTCQPAAFEWSARGAFVLRHECFTGRLIVSEGTRGAHLRDDEPLEFLAFSFDESLVAARTLDGGLVVERLRSGERVLRLAGPNRAPATDVLFSRDGKRLLVARGTTIDVWDLEAGAGRVVDTPSAALGILETDTDATAAWIEGRWLPFAGAPPPQPLASPTALGFDAKKLASKGEGFDVSLALPRPGTNEVFVVGIRTQAVTVQDSTGTMGIGKRFAIVDTATGTVEHVFEDAGLDERDWAWTSDGASLVTRAETRLVVLSPDLRIQNADDPPIALPPNQPLRRWVSLFGGLDEVVGGAKLLAEADLPATAAPRAIHPSTRFLAFAIGATVVVLDRSTGARLQLSCGDLGETRGCLATADDGRFTATPAIAPLLARDGEVRERPDLVKAFFATTP